MRALWADKHPETLSALIRALDAAARWAAQPANHGELAALLAQPEYLGVPAACIARALSGRMIFSAGAEPRPVDDFLVFHRKAANFPWVSQALWLYAQMVRWRQVEPSAKREATVRRVYRRDLYRQALHGRAMLVPLEDCKVEGALAGEAAVAAVEGWVSLGPDCLSSTPGGSIRSVSGTTSRPSPTAIIVQRRWEYHRQIRSSDSTQIVQHGRNRYGPSSTSH